MKLWLILDEDNYTPANESIEPAFLNNLHIENLFWDRKLLISLSETGRLHSSIFKHTMRYTVSLYRLRNYRTGDPLYGINTDKIHAFLDAPTANLLNSHVDMIYVIRVKDKHQWRYGRFDTLDAFSMFDTTDWGTYQGVRMRIERWVKTSK